MCFSGDYDYWLSGMYFRLRSGHREDLLQVSHPVVAHSNVSHQHLLSQLLPHPFIKTSLRKTEEADRLVDALEHTLGHFELVQVTASQEGTPLVGAEEGPLLMVVENVPMTNRQFYCLFFKNIFYRCNG